MTTRSRSLVPLQEYKKTIQFRDIQKTQIRVPSDMASAMLASPLESEEELVGSSLSPVMHARTVARTDATVLIQGETGTGKELIARAIHMDSLRRLGPCVKLNCAAMPAGLIESELFGHERGAFTGACTQTTGRFQMAHRGTLFLDEVGDMPLELQPKLLRVLQEQEFERLGSGRTIRVDVRVIAATNQDLLQLVQERRFRADLYYRLNVFPITLPPLRERPGDITVLARHFVRKIARRMNKEINYIPDEVLAVLKLHHWPGNIRELQNVIERAVIVCSGPILHLPHFETKHLVPSNAPVAAQTLAEAEKEHITAMLRQTGGRVGGPAGAAARLGVARTTLLHRMHKLGVGTLN
jgi:formate hydrogenlyase transcriptional activator